MKKTDRSITKRRDLMLQPKDLLPASPFVTELSCEMIHRLKYEHAPSHSVYRELDADFL